MLSSLIPAWSDVPAYGRLALWFAVVNAVLRLLGVAFGPFVNATWPRAYAPLAALGEGIRTALNDAMGLVRMLTPQKPTPSKMDGGLPSVEPTWTPPAPPPTIKPPPLPILLALVALGLVGCPRLPQPDGCQPHEQRCHAGAPQICSQSARWTPADRACADLGPDITCCPTPSAYGGKRIIACVPSNRCVAEGAPQ